MLSSATSRIVLTSSIITTHPSRIACTNAESTSRTVPAVVGGGDELVAEQILVAGRAAADLHEPVERDAVAVLDLPAAVSPQPVGDRAGDLALAGSGRTDQPQERRLAGTVACRSARRRVRRSARRAAAAGRSACRPGGRSDRSATRARAGRGRARGRGRPRWRPGRWWTGLDRSRSCATSFRWWDACGRRASSPVDGSARFRRRTRWRRPGGVRRWRRSRRLAWRRRPGR